MGVFKISQDAELDLDKNQKRADEIDISEKQKQQFKRFHEILKDVGKHGKVIDDETNQVYRAMESGEDQAESLWDDHEQDQMYREFVQENNGNPYVSSELYEGEYDDMVISGEQLKSHSVSVDNHLYQKEMKLQLEKREREKMNRRK